MMPLEKVLFAFLLTLSFSIPGCTCSRSPSGNQSGPKSSSWGVGTRPFQFEIERTQELLISKQDPESGDRWSMRLISSQPGQWRLSAGKEGQPLTDALADTGFIRHLLSTLQTLSLSKLDVPISSSAAGLTPPRFALRWQTGEEWEVHIGSELPDHTGAYALFPGRAGNDRIFAVSGALMAMLAHIQSFDHLRLRRLSTWDMDRVEEFEIRSGLKKTFLAQRLSGDWGDDQARPYSPGVNDWLERLLHLQIREFVDDPAESQRLYERVQKLPAYQVILKDRRGASITFSLALERGIWWATNSERAQAAFRLHPESAMIFTKPNIKVTKKARR